MGLNLGLSNAREGQRSKSKQGADTPTPSMGSGSPSGSSSFFFLGAIVHNRFRSVGLQVNSLGRSVVGTLRASRDLCRLRPTPPVQVERSYHWRHQEEMRGIMAMRLPDGLTRYLNHWRSNTTTKRAFLVAVPHLTHTSMCGETHPLAA